MINLDTNILLRVVKTDPDSPKQSELARRHVQGLWDDGTSLYVTTIALVECCWVLQSCYDTSKEGIIKFVEYVIGLDLTRLEHPKETGAALESYTKGRGDFS